MGLQIYHNKSVTYKYMQGKELEHFAVVETAGVSLTFRNLYSVYRLEGNYYATRLLNVHAVFECLGVDRDAADFLYI